ncbi:hypothetical protein OJAV_G00012110 [Oryzias javanicus]|uniref:BTB domain-containing protein n=1 Tax=Oryzias javanicus TaxID=123683 RepID=A0A437DP78_ORYJA|nr:hypothetical protein OJAV_G00012110 [Oryzias javanicus]
MAADLLFGKKPPSSAGTTAAVQRYQQQNVTNNNTSAAQSCGSWQGLYPTIRERNSVMFNNEMMADVHFVVGPPGGTQRVPGHKYVLAVGSSVFHAMFYGELAEDQEEIRIPDVEPPSFLAMLKYIYCDEIDLCADTVLATLYAAKKYIVPHLARACVNFLETSLSAKNACVLLSQSCLFEEPDLTQRCWEVIDAQAELALRSEGFCDIDAQTLESILLRETLNAKETVVFEAALSWAEAECQRRQLPPTIDNKRLVLDKAIYLIRIPTMALEDFANGAAQSGVLTLNETNDIFLWYTASNKPEMRFCSKPRKGLAPQRCHRFQSCAYRSNQWRYRGPLRQHPVRRGQAHLHRGLRPVRLQLRLRRVQRQDRAEAAGRGHGAAAHQVLLGRLQQHLPRLVRLPGPDRARHLLHGQRGSGRERAQLLRPGGHDGGAVREGHLPVPVLLGQHQRHGGAGGADPRAHLLRLSRPGPRLRPRLRSGRRVDKLILLLPLLDGPAVCSVCSGAVCSS